MTLKFVRVLSISAIVVCSFAFHAASAVAQGQGGVGAGTGTGGFGTGTTTGTGTSTGGTSNTSGSSSSASGTAGNLGVLDASSSFSGVSRGATVGSTGSTGLGFSDLSVGAQGGTGLSGGGARGGFGGLGGLGGLFGGAGLGTNAQTTKPAIRTRLRSAVEIPAMPSGYVQQNVSRNLQSVSSRAGMNGVGVTVENGTAVVTGVVKNEHDRRMSELLMRLEPSVRRVDNRVIVAP